METPDFISKFNYCPNPVAESFQVIISKKTADNVYVRIASPDGMEVRNLIFKDNSSAITIDVEDLSPGIYILMISVSYLNEQHVLLKK